MATSSSQHQRNASATSGPSTNTRKRPNATFRASRPANLSRRVTPAKPHKNSQSQDQDSASRSEKASEPDDQETMLFQQFCAACEKQMLVDNASVLYCSDSCRKIDTSRSPSYSLFKSDLTPPQSPGHMGEGPFQHGNDIVPQRSPTVSFSLQGASSEADSAGKDSRKQSRPQLSDCESEAAKFLQKFHHEEACLSQQDSRTSSTGTGGTPSLSSTPASSAGTSVPYTPSSTSPSVYRNVSRNNQRKSIDLVTPVTAASVRKEGDRRSSGSSDEFDSAQISYEKMEMMNQTGSPGESSLRTLFASPESRVETES